jgi:fumarate reductase flavoprotein subunit
MATKDRREVADLVVVGGSVGGMVGALEAADQGGRVVVVESRKELGGAAESQPEHVALAGSDAQAAAGVADDPEILLRDLEAETHHHLTREVADAVVGEGRALGRWLTERLGLRVELVPGSRYRGHSRPRLHVIGAAGGHALVDALRSALARHHRVRVLGGIPAASLLTSDGAVVGIDLATRRRSDPTSVDGPVLLACGGHAADVELAAGEAPDLAALPPLGADTAVGSGVRLARQAGARIDALGSHLVTGLIAVPSEIALDPMLVSLGAILVNQAGRRFIDESVEAIPLALAVYAQPGHVAYLIFDDRVADAAKELSRYLADVALPRAARRADRLEDLARQLEIDEDALVRTIDTLNANLELGGDPFGRTDLPAPLAPRFHAARVTASRWRSLGGVAIDSAARVIDPDGAPIVGLFAAGGVVGGLGRGGPADEMPGIATLIALATARIAARSWSTARTADEG